MHFYPIFLTIAQVFELADVFEITGLIFSRKGTFL